MKNLFYTLILCLISFSSFSQWNTDSTLRNPICTAVKNQYNPRSCSDGNGGAFITWVDERIITQPTAYAQHINKKGKVLWATEGIAVSDPTFDMVYSLIVSDGSGGAILVFEISVLGGAHQLWAQHIDASGTLLWGSSGVKLTDITDSRLSWAEDPEQDGISADGAGGAFITWQAYQSSNYIFAQHISASGNLVWGTTGVGLNGSYVYVSNIVSTGAGTAVIGYTDGVYKYYLQRLAADGSYLWGAAGLLISSINYYQKVGVLAYDGSSATPSVMAAFQTQNTPGFNNPVDVNMQKIDLNGNILWKPGGINITKNINNTIAAQPDIIPDYKGGVFAVYTEGLAATAQHLNSLGKKTWGANGALVDYTPNANDANPVLVTDGGTGFITVFHTSRQGEYNPIYAQHFNSAGTALWRVSGVPVIANYADINHEVNPTVAGAKGYVITCWHDERVSGDDNIYAARVGGATGFEQPVAQQVLETNYSIIQLQHKNSNTSIQVYPNPAVNSVTISFNLTANESNANLELYNTAAKKVKQLSLENLTAGKNTYLLNTEGLSAGIYQLVLKFSFSSMQTKLVIVK